MTGRWSGPADPVRPASNGRTEARIRRLAEELDEVDPAILAAFADPSALLEELDYALRPVVHEHRVPSYGAIVEPATELGAWPDAAGLTVTRRRVEELRDDTVRLLADGVSSWVVRSRSGVDDLVVFDRSVGSERDLTVLVEATAGAIVQRHPSGLIRAAGSFGVLRRDEFDWHLELPFDRWLRCAKSALPAILKHLLPFAVHDVGARRIGATLVVTPDGELLPSSEGIYGKPPEFNVGRPADLAPLYHILGQLDGAAVFDEAGTLTALGVRLVPSRAAEAEVAAFGGTRHTSALRYSHDDPGATVIVVSEEGPVTVIQRGEILGRSR